LGRSDSVARRVRLVDWEFPSGRRAEVKWHPLSARGSGRQSDRAPSRP
jgi:hypothetical protein